VREFAQAQLLPHSAAFEAAGGYARLQAKLEAVQDFAAKQATRDEVKKSRSRIICGMKR